MLFVMEEQEGTRNQTLRALQVTAVSGFVKGVCEIQRSCLDLCNACRDGVPISLLSMKNGVPPGLLRLLYPDLHQPETDPVSRIVPHRRVLSVELKYSYYYSDFGMYVGLLQAKDGWNDGEAVDLNKITWPEGTIHIFVHMFNQPIQGVVWPESLERLVFGGPLDCHSHGIFNQSLDGVHFPSCLGEIFLGEAFDQPIDNVSWPEGLKTLSLPGFNRPIDKVRWPAGLKVLEFMPSSHLADIKRGGAVYGFDHSSPFNQPIDTGLPTGLHTLWLSHDFKQPIDDVAWPTGLVTIGFGYEFSQDFNGIVWPSTLREVFLTEGLAVEQSELPPGCDVRRWMYSSFD